MLTTLDKLGAPMRTGNSWLARWEPEDASFWAAGGSARAWLTLAVTTFNLTLAFIVWFAVSALVVRLPGLGFKLSNGQLFWLAAMPGLAGGTLRIVHTFLTPMMGTRNVVALSTLSLLLPALGWFYAVQDNTTPYWMLMTLAFVAGLGGGNFSSFMPSTSLFFPKRLQGTALAIQAGIGNFGVSVVQFVTPWIIGFALADGLLGDGQTFHLAGGATRTLWSLRIPVQYLANLLTAGHEAPVVLALQRMMAMRMHMRARTVDNRLETDVLDQVGLTVEQVEEMYKIMALADYEDRFVIPSTHREYAENTFDIKSACGFTFGNGCSSTAGSTGANLFSTK